MSRSYTKRERSQDKGIKKRKVFDNSFYDEIESKYRHKLKQKGK